jgi:cytochrome c-type biogenesis protein
MPEVSLAAAFAAGLLAFFTPCVLPIVPGFLAFVAGRSGAGVVAAGRARRLALTACFVLGFGVAFTAIGWLLGAAGAGVRGQEAQLWFRRVGGVLIIAFGLAMLGLWRLPWMDRDLRVHAVSNRLGPVSGALALGAAFGVGWTPCVGPILASIFLQAGLGGSGAGGALLLAAFSAGLAVPFLAFGLAADAGAGFVRRHGRATLAIEVAGGLFLVALGVMVYTGAANRVLLYLGGVAS